MINVYRLLLEGAFAMLKVFNPSHLSSTIDVLRFIETALAELQADDSKVLSDNQMKWLGQIK